MAHYPLFQKGVDELLANGATEPSTCGADFYSNVFVVPKHTDSLILILNLREFKH